MGRNRFQACADDRAGGLDEWHSLSLLVASHQTAVNVVLFNKRNQTSATSDNLVARSINMRNIVGVNFTGLEVGTGADTLIEEVAIIVNLAATTSDDG